VSAGAAVDASSPAPDRVKTYTGGALPARLLRLGETTLMPGSTPPSSRPAP
jgi:hypothetical protein